jgi:hypothetical protein
MQKIETKLQNKVTYSFSEEEYQSHKFLALKKVVPPFKEGIKTKIQVLSVKPTDLPQFKTFLQRIINEAN